MNIAFPFRITGKGRTALADDDAHIRQMIEQLLFTSPGERVNRPQFGTGLLQMIFAPNSPEVATATEYMVKAALQQYLGEVISLEGLQVEATDSTLRVVVQYVRRRDQQRNTAEFLREV